ncbi:hypothetical protein K2173_002073 [Erythroxylum novogranatense]|uniref:Uncharacterized protein n=1 Tax=Erythroxylum novogranatense TaxID=1862640 RepID=A0AAV8SQ96_9ROSI|nr:hypothetical protein K2173_002073 [Erythroxylum novogranatense]
MNESVENFGFDISRRLSLIDVSFEDDCLLYASPSPDLEIRQVSDTSTEAGKEVCKPDQSSEPEGTAKSGRYNLRKSLAWDNAFFTSAGVLEPEELSTMITGNEKGRKHMLPGIEEDVQKSSESISTLASDNLTIDTLDADLFGDIRASIQKSGRALNLVNSTNEVQSGIKDNRTAKSTEKEDATSQIKLNTKAALEKPNAMQGSGRTLKQSTSFITKPPKVVGRVGPISTSASKRISLGANRNTENGIATVSPVTSNNEKRATGRCVKFSASGSSRNNASRSKLPSKPSSCSSVATKTQIITPASSADSSENLSSDDITGESSDSMKRKVYTKAGKDQATPGSTIKRAGRILSRNVHRSTNSNISPCLEHPNKLPSRISPASSVSEWSAESLSPTSTLNKGSNHASPSFDTSEDGDANQVLDSQNHSHENRSTGHCSQRTGSTGEALKKVQRGTIGISAPLGTESVKRSGLRKPSPKIGFFDGVRTAATRSPNESTQSRLALPNALPKIRAGTGSVSPQESQLPSLGKSQPAGESFNRVGKQGTPSVLKDKVSDDTGTVKGTKIDPS